MCLSKICKLSRGYKEDSLIGISMCDRHPHVIFPLGYRIPNYRNDSEVRKCILDLLWVIIDCKNEKAIEGDLSCDSVQAINCWPVQAYLILINNYLDSTDYYAATRDEYAHSSSGKINWLRTILHTHNSHARHILSSDLIRRKKFTTKGDHIANIHKYCTYVSFLKLGWLYSMFVPPKFKLPYSKHSCLALIKKELNNTFNDTKQIVLNAMYEVLNYETGFSQLRQQACGTKSFNVVWEMMVRNIFGTVDIREFYSYSHWVFTDNSSSKTSPLKPDCIMQYGDSCYVIDAKYYRTSAKSANLPQISDINKQIAYGMIADNLLITETQRIYNVFVLCENLNSEAHMNIIAYSQSDWLPRNSDRYKSYHNIFAVSMDTRWLIETYLGSASGKMSARRELAKLIGEAYSSYFLQHS